MLTTTAARAPGSSTSYAELLKVVRAQGLLERRRVYYIVKMGLTFLALAAVLTAVPFVGESWWQLGLAAALALVLTQVIFLGHDAAHRQVFASHKANEWMSIILGTAIGGISIAWWNNKHSKHHAAPNQIDKDPDIAPGVVAFYATDKAPDRGFVTFMRERQGWWFYPLLLLELLNLHAQSVMALANGKTLKRRRTEIAILAFRLGIAPALLFLLLPLGMAFAFLGVFVGLGGLYLGCAFAASHVGMAVIPKGERLDFFARQVRTSRNVKGGRAANFAMGGLNYQIEHHLFPNMPGPNLRKARPIVRQFCADQVVDYHEVTIFRAWNLVSSHLNKVGLKDPSAFACPIVSAYRPT